MTNDDGRALLVELLHRIAPEADLAEVDPDAPMQEALDLDSMDYLNLLTALSEETGIDVPEQDYPKLSTANGFAAYVASASVSAPARDAAGLVTFDPG